MECENCKNETDLLYWNPSYPLLITKEQEWRGVTPSGDYLLKVCANCKDKAIFHDPEFPPKN